MSMTVGELKSALANIDDKRIVVISRDAEGNSYVRMSEIETDMKLDDGEPKYEALTEELESQGFGSDDVAVGGTPCVVLWPEG